MNDDREMKTLKLSTVVGEMEFPAPDINLPDETATRVWVSILNIVKNINNESYKRKMDLHAANMTKDTLANILANVTGGMSPWGWLRHAEEVLKRNNGRVRNLKGD